ncbi:MAG TPA: hypothetical protein VK942_00125 [Actinomycetes bacterium]|nr:hypothetical protein [Actinomycetes bacterium]
MDVITVDYKRRHRPRAESELAYFRSLSRDEDAISQAALAKRSDGKRFRHQCRIPRDTLEEESRRALLNNISRVREAESFDQLLVDIPEPVWLAVGPSLRASKGWRFTIG